MNVITNAINNYRAYRWLIKEQIKKEKEYIKACEEDIKSLMKLEYVPLRIKVYGNHPAIDRNQMAIMRHKMNIEKLKKGDIYFLFELMLKEQKNKQSPLNSLIVELLDVLEEQVEVKQQPKMHKPGSMSIDDFNESCDKGIKTTKEHITRLLEGDVEVYNKLEQAMYRRRYTD